MVARLRASDGSPQGTFAVGSQCYGVAFDGANVWVTSYNNSNVTKLRASDGALQGTFTVGNQPYGVAFDGRNLGGESKHQQCQQAAGVSVKLGSY